MQTDQSGTATEETKQPELVFDEDGTENPIVVTAWDTDELKGHLKTQPKWAASADIRLAFNGQILNFKRGQIITDLRLIERLLNCGDPKIAPVMDDLKSAVCARCQCHVRIARRQ